MNMILNKRKQWYDKLMLRMMLAKLKKALDHQANKDRAILRMRLVEKRKKLGL